MANDQKRHRRRVARTPEQQENILINLAMDLAMKKLEDGTASSQLICQILGYASTKERLRNEKVQSEIELNAAKQENLRENSMSNELYKKAIDAFRRYSGQGPIGDEDDLDDDPYFREDD